VQETQEYERGIFYLFFIMTNTNKKTKKNCTKLF